MKHYIDIDQWERRENFLFFQSINMPCVDITCRVECRHAREKSKERGESFFLYYLYAILKAANSIEAMKYRIDKEGRVVRYDRLNVLTPIKLPGMKGFSEVCIAYHEAWDTFYQEAKKQIAHADKMSAYEIENNHREYDVILVSAIPGLAFTSVTCAQMQGGNNYPLICVGMMLPDYEIPISLCVHHGFMDGEHITEFYRKTKEVLDEL